MDLTRIDAWTRQMVEAEARKRGVAHPERHSRKELARLILRHDYKSVRSLDDARQLITNAVHTASRIVPDALRAFDFLRTKLPPTAAKPEAPRAAMWTQEDVTPKPEPVSRARPPRPSARADQKPPAEPVVAEEAEILPSDGPTTRSFVEEPIRTHSMARLLATQGHKERALAIYEELMAKNSADQALLREAEALRRGGVLTFAMGELPMPSTHVRTDLPTTSDRVECEAHGDGALRVRWDISESGRERARAVLGGQGELAVRLVSIVPDVDNVVRSEITEHGPIGERGEWTTQQSTHSTRAFASIGVRHENRFVSIKHASVE